MSAEIFGAARAANPDDAAEMDGAFNEVDSCDSRFDFYGCTRLPSHDGDHVAGGSIGMVLARWSQDHVEDP